MTIVKGVNADMTVAQILSCDHDWRRVYVTDINKTAKPRDEVLCICCCICGRSPMFMLQRGEAGGPAVKEDWPEDRRIVGYFWHEDDGPRVEYKMKEAT